MHRGGEIAQSTNAPARAHARPTLARTALWLLLSLLAIGVLSPSPAGAARGHLPGPSVGGACSSQPCAPGTLIEPSAVAVQEATGELYIADSATGLVTELTREGAVVSGFGDNGPGGTPNGQLTGPSATGSGTLTEGSATITEALASTGAFALGEQITGPGIPAGSTITGLPGGGVLEISQPVEAGGSSLGAALSARLSFADPQALAVDDSTDPSDPSKGDLYVLDAATKQVEKFSATGAFIAQLPGLGAELEGQLTGVAVDSQGRVFVASQIGVVFVFDNAESNAAQAPTSAFKQGCFDLLGFALDDHGNLYVNTACSLVAKFAPGGALLDASFLGQSAAGLASELSSDDLYADTGEALVRIAPDGLHEGAPLERLALAGADGRGLAVDSSRETLYVAQAQTGTVEVFTPEPPGPPSVEGEAVSAVTADSASLQAQIDPRTEAGEQATEYSFQYGPCPSLAACASSPYPDQSAPATLPASFEVDAVTPVSVQGLSPGTPYHFRVLAENGHEDALHEKTVLGEERTFTTQAEGGFTLPDARAWELVSPPDKHGAGLEGIGSEVTVQASADGAAMTYAADAPTEPEPPGYSGPVQVLSARGPAGWSSRDLAIPHQAATGVGAGKGAQYRLFSEDLSHAVVQPFGSFMACTGPEGEAQPCLSAEASEQTAFLQQTYLARGPGEPCLPALAHCFQPLVTAAPGFANVPPGTRFGDESRCQPPAETEYCGPEFLDATPELNHVVLRSNASLTSPASGGLYEFSAGLAPDKQLAPVDLLPPGEGGGPAAAALLGFNGEDTRHVISADGSRVFFQTATSAKTEGPLYLRDLAAERTLRITPGAGEFQDASSDGKHVFYSEGGTLFECAIGETGGEPTCPPTELAPGLLGAVLGAGSDGTRLYFAATSALAPGAVAGSPNLYLRDGEGTRLIAVLAPADAPDWSGADVGDLAALSARVSPNGRWLSFMSRRPLTGYDNRDANSGQADEEVFLYDAGTRRLTCASCDPSGARPAGQEAAEASPRKGGFVVGAAWESSSSWLAAEVPEWTAYRLKDAVYQSRYLSDSGRLFFNAVDALVPQAVNGNWDVYEYEPEGQGGCRPGVSSGASVYEPARAFHVDSEGVSAEGESGAGCLGLISSGESGRDSAFMDASQSGDDVFFLTAARLSGADADNAFDVYDAHVCSEQAPCPPSGASQPPPCDNEASCKPSQTPQPPVFGAPASATLSPSANLAPGTPPKGPTAAQLRAHRLARALRACRRKHARRRRAACERAARRAYGARPADRARRR